MGIIANNPMYMAGSLNADCCDKVTGFLVLCDSYNLPVIHFVDTPGFMVGVQAEKTGIVSKIINWMNALSLVSVPKITVVIRKDYGQAYLNMGGGKNVDCMVAWPSAEISFTDPTVGVNIVWGVKKEDDSERFENLIKDFKRNIEPWGAAGHFGIQDVIDPADTRDYLLEMLEMHSREMLPAAQRHRLANWPTSY